MEGDRCWHVIISPRPQGRKSRRDDAVALDKDREWIERRVLEPRRRGEPIAVAGQTFEWSEIERVRITVSDEPSAQIVDRLKYEDQQSSVAVFGGPGYGWRAAARAQDVTDELIEGPPGTLSPNDAATHLQPTDARAVMIVHGRNEAARRAMFDFLRALHLKPLEWGNLISRTDKAAPYVGEVLENAFREAAAVVVLFTPDDEARLRSEFHGPGEPKRETELLPQARPNVLFEAGMALGVHPTRTILVELGELRPFSDIYGRHVVRLDGTEQPLRDIARRLRDAGCDVDDSGDDWAWPERFNVL